MKAISCHLSVQKVGPVHLTANTYNSAGSDEQYEGATVIEPTKGYYDVPIATLDFASLYPSIMMAHNLCYTTLLDAKVVKELNLVKDVDYIVTPNNGALCRSIVSNLILDRLLRQIHQAQRITADCS